MTTVQYQLTFKTETNPTTFTFKKITFDDVLARKSGWEHFGKRMASLVNVHVQKASLLAREKQE